MALLGALAIASAGRAASANEEDAKTLFAEGRELRRKGRCEEAIPRFQRALAIFPEGLGALRNVAECQAELKLHASARRSFWDLRRAVLLANQPRYRGWVEDAEAAHAELGDVVPRVTVRVVGAPPDRVRLLMDGRVLDHRLLGTELERDVGKHRVELYFGGAAPVVREVEVAERSRAVVVLQVPKGAPLLAPARPAGGAAPKPTPPAPEERPRLLPAVGFGLVGVGSLAAIGAGVAFAIRQSALAEIERDCPGYQTGPCPRGLEGAEERGEQATLAANVLTAVALPSLALGVTFVVAGSGPSKADGAERPRGEKPRARSEGGPRGPRGGAGASLRVELAPQPSGAAGRAVVRF